MYIQDILSTEQSEYVSSLTKKSDKDNDADSSISSPLSWGSDKVSISAEARAAQQSAASGDQNTGESEEESEEDATAAFGDFMAKAKGAKTASDPSEQIEALKSKLTQLQSKKAQILSSQGLGEEAKMSQASAIDGQINQIMALIADLEAQMSQAA